MKSYFLCNGMYLQVQKSLGPHMAFESSIDQGPYVNVLDGMVAPVGSESDQPSNGSAEILVGTLNSPCENGNGNDAMSKRKMAGMRFTEQESGAGHAASPMRRCIDLIIRESRRPVWLLAHIAILVTWPMVGSALRVLIARKFRKALPAPPAKR